MGIYRVLIGSPVHQSNEILNEFLISLKELDKENLEVNYFFIDDNINENSSNLLKKFQDDNDNVYIEKSNMQCNIYMKNETTHMWTENLISKVAGFKNRIIEFAKKNEYDYLFFIDSDIVISPKTLLQLINDKKDVISNIFWTRWQPETMEMPQVWVKDSYLFYNKIDNFNTSDEDILKQTKEFLTKLRIPGVYKVGGLGACTLLSKNALIKGVNFNSIYNISFWGEDRAFCIRAAALGLELFVDTNYPAYHIYRESDLHGVENYKRELVIKEEEKKAEQTKMVRIFIENYLIGKYKNEDNSLNIESVNIDRLDNINFKAIAIMNEIRYIEDISYLYKYKFEAYLLVENDEIVLNEIREIEKLENPNKYIVRIAKKIDNKLVLSMIVKNEEGRYLEKALLKHREFIDKAVFIDDGSTDKTIDIIKNCLSGIPIVIERNEESKFKNEIELRKQQWNLTMKSKADWALILDADEIFEDNFKDYVQGLINNRDYDAYSFRVYDFWSENEYREDALWGAHKFYRCFLVRGQENFKYEWRESAQHCGRVPYNIYQLPNAISNLRLKHYGWAKEEDRIQKYKRYMELDTNGIFGSLPQYNSILDKNPNLVTWIE